MTNPVRTGNFNGVKNMRTCFASGTFAFGSARWRLRITSTNNAVSNVAFTTICGDRRNVLAPWTEMRLFNHPPVQVTMIIAFLL